MSGTPILIDPSAERLRLRERLSYGFGDFASCLYWQTFSAYLAIFYTDVFGLSALAAGTMIGLSRSTDAFFDPVIGMVSDRTKSRWGKFRPYLLFGCVPLAVIGLLTFTVPSFGAHGKLIWAYATFNALMLSFTVVNIPYAALLGAISPNPNEVMMLSSIKFVGAFTAGIVISATLLPMAKVGGWLGAHTVEHGWEMTFSIYGAVAVASFLIVFLNTKERVLPPPAERTSVLRDLRDVMTNRPWLVLMATTITFILSVALRGSVTAHYFKYFVGSQIISLPSFLPSSVAGTQRWAWEGLVSAFNATSQILSLLGVILVPFFIRVTGRKVGFVILFSISVLTTVSFLFLKPNQVPIMFVLAAIGSLTGGPLSPLLLAMYADTADYAEWKTGRRPTGLIFSASIFSQKQGWAVGAAIALILMNSVGFVANQVQTASTLNGLIKLMSIYPATIGVLAMLIMVVLYPLNEKRMSQISNDLKVRRAESRNLAATV